jgi:hypothetical protein
MTHFSNVFSNEDLDDINHLPEVLDAKEKLATNNVVSFTIPLTETIRAYLTQIGLDLSNAEVTRLPMRWIKGDTSPHIDSGSTRFENTYLAYLNDCPGEFIIDGVSYPITANTAFVFNEGLSHTAKNTESQPRLLLGPMNEFAEAVGSTIQYYDNYADAYAQNGNYIGNQGFNWVIGDPAYIYGNIGNYTSWRVANVYGGGAIPTGTYNNGFDLSTLGLGSNTFFLYPSAPCFLEGSTVLSLVDNVEKYVKIETLTTGDLVKTSRNGYKKIEFIGKGNVFNPGNDERTENRLYKCSTTNFPELIEDLYITGCHSILVDTITDVQREQLIKQMGRIFITDRKYRLIASVDERAEPWNSEGNYAIWHLALENNDPKMNYGIYVNGGLLVETCSLNFFKKWANLNI